MPCVELNKGAASSIELATSLPCSVMAIQPLVPLHEFTPTTSSPCFHARSCLSPAALKERGGIPCTPTQTSAAADMRRLESRNETACTPDEGSPCEVGPRLQKVTLSHSARLVNLDIALQQAIANLPRHVLHVPGAMRNEDGVAARSCTDLLHGVEVLREEDHVHDVLC